MTARPRILAANWKMNLGPAPGGEFVRTFVAAYSPRPGRRIAFFPPAVTLAAVAAAARGREDLAVGAQNIYWEPKGAFTGETSAALARDAGASLVLVGHSERRHVFGESDADTARKCAAALAAGLEPLLCVGERLEEREAGTTPDVVVRQLTAAVRGLDAAAAGRLTVAYEPVWAIGTGRTATATDAGEVHAVLRGALSDLLGTASDAVAILYGGSVTPTNAAGLLAAPGVDGLLVGGASLDVASWLAIAQA